MTSAIRMGAAAIGFAISTLFAFGQPMAAERASGMIANRTLAPQITKFKDGHSIMRVSSVGVILTDDPKGLFNGSKSACAGLFTIAADGKSSAGRGSCGYVDKAGDVYWLSWQGTLAGGTYKFDGGTGKFQSLTGGGSYTAVASGDGVSVTKFEGSYEIK